MIQLLKASCSSLGIQHSLPQVFHVSAKHPTRQVKLLSHEKTKRFRRFSCPTISASKDNFCTTPRRDGNKLKKPSVATLDGAFVLQPEDDSKVTLLNYLLKQWDVFNRFCRLHSVAGTVTGVISVSLLPLTSLGDLSPAFFVGLLKAVIPFALVNIYVVGLNQLTDIEIDKINKPYLVLPSGEYTMGQGKAITCAFGFMCLALGIIFRSPPLFIGILVHFLLGTAYSLELPFLRWKTNPYLAALCIMGLSGFNSQLAVFCHIQKYVLGRRLVLTKSLGFTVIFCSVFAAVIAMFKDIPDVEGDRAHGNETFSVKYGKFKMFSLCISTMLIAYGSAIVVGASSSFLLSRIISVLGHCTLVSVLWLKASSLDLEDDSLVESFYMFIWKLLRAEYVLIHFIH